MKFILVPLLALTVACTPAAVAPQATSKSPQQSPEAAKPADKVNKANFGKIKTGMSLSEVEAILGKGELISESEVMNSKTQFYNWTSKSFASITITFQDGAVLSKAQSGLQSYRENPDASQRIQLVSFQIDSTQQPTATPIREPRSGSCECPYDTDRRGRSCGGRSAYSRPGGDAPACYVGE